MEVAVGCRIIEGSFPLWMVGPLPALSSLLPFLDDLLSCFLGKSGKMRSSGRTKAFQSHNQICTSFPAWGLAVVAVGTETWDTEIRISLCNKRGPIKSFKAIHTEKQYNIPCPNKKAFLSCTGPLPPFLPWDQRLSQRGLGQGSRICVFLPS